MKNLKVAVMGLGKSGLSVVKLLSKRGCNIFVSDSAPESPLPFGERVRVRGEFGGHTNKILEHDLIVVSPGIHLDLPVLKQARKKKIPILNELELGYRLTKFKRMAAITGTNGKTTTTALLGAMCVEGGQKTLVAGNIGSPLCDYAGTLGFDTAVLEVSSYQLEGIDTFHPQVSAILNLTNDHLQRHKTMAGYAKAKERVFLNQTSKDFCVLNADDRWCVKMGAHCKSKKVWFSTKRKLKEGVYYDPSRRKIAAKFGAKILDFSLPKHLLGLHNVENACAAIACALKLGVSPAAIERTLNQFTAVEHRLEKVKTIDGVDYINDSKGTNVDSTVKAMLSFDTPLWLILGGQDKGGSYEPIRSLILKKSKTIGPVKSVLLIGEAAKKIDAELKGVCPTIFCGDMANAVKKAKQSAVPGDTVLLSPACASFDQYKNFEERGKDFKKKIGLDW